MEKNRHNQVGTGKPNPRARRWSELGFEPGSTEMKGRDRSHWANLTPKKLYVCYPHIQLHKANDCFRMMQWREYCTFIERWNFPFNFHENIPKNAFITFTICLISWACLVVGAYLVSQASLILTYTLILTLILYKYCIQEWTASHHYLPLYSAQWEASLRDPGFQHTIAESYRP